MLDLVPGHVRMTQVPVYTLLHISKPFNKTEGTENFVTERTAGGSNCNTITNSNYGNAEVHVFIFQYIQKGIF